MDRPSTTPEYSIVPVPRIRPGKRSFATRRVRSPREFASAPFADVAVRGIATYGRRVYAEPGPTSRPAWESSIATSIRRVRSKTCGVNRCSPPARAT
jgi:hypothetical protein